VAVIFENILILVVMLVAFLTFVAFAVFCAGTALRFIRERRGAKTARR
jgi:hypothetical protein